MTEQDTVGTTVPTTSRRLDPAVVRIALAVVAGGIAVIFDTTIVGVALRQLAAHLDTTVSTIQWVATGYLLAMFLAIPATGWLQARIGGKRLWLAALGVFLLGSVLCAFAWDAPSLIAFADLVVSAGGTMNREAVALGTPVYTTFAGRMGAVDERLIAQGRLLQLKDADEIVLAKRERAADGSSADRIRRDPRILTDLLLTALD